MTAQPLGPSGALKVAMELIDAQAKHIKALERGHWSRETRAKVEELRDELDIVTAAEQPPLYDAGGQLPTTGLRRVGAPDLTEYTTISSPGDPGHPVVEPLGRCTDGGPQPGESFRSPADAYLTALARLEAASDTAPDHELVPHLLDAWAAKGTCRRCDIMQPLVDAERRAHQDLINANHPEDSDYYSTLNREARRRMRQHDREAGIQHDGQWQEPETGPGRTEGGGRS